MRNRGKIGVGVFVLFGLAVGVEARWRAEFKDREQTQILSQVEALVTQTKNPVVIFDLDSTLYDNRYRSVAIWKEYGKKFDIPQLKKINSQHLTSWVMKDYLIKEVGLDPIWVAGHLEELESFWTQRFFSNDYLHYDRPMPGAIAYVNKLYQQGATIVYLTGRDAVNMREGTLAALKRDRFPIDQARTHLFLKPQSNIALSQKFNSDDARIKAFRKNDLDFKTKAVREVWKLGRPVASFDNEPANINFYFQKLHRGNSSYAIWLDTDHSPAAEPVQEGILKISGFRR